MSEIPLEPLPEPPDVSRAGEAAANIGTEPMSCIRCAYQLQGLPESGICPECGTPISMTLEAFGSGFRLVKSSPEYVSTLLSGSRLVLEGILAQVVLIILGVAVGIMIATMGNLGWLGVLQWVLSVASLVVGLVIALGWWRLSEPDPALSGLFDGGNARQIVRFCILINIAATFVNTALGLILLAASSAVLAFVAGGIGLISAMAGIVAFFAQMLYIRWLAPRLPNPAVARRAKTLLWLGPVLYTFGLLLLGLGPVIALVLYWTMLDRVRTDLIRIHAEQSTPSHAV